MAKLKAKITLDDSMSDTQIHELGVFMAGEFYDRLMANIKNNTYGFSNSNKTLSRKIGNVPMIDSGEFIRQIYADDNKVRVMDGNSAKSGISFSELASILEFGRKDNNFKGFPVWRKTLEDFKKDIPTLLEKFKNS